MTKQIKIIIYLIFLPAVCALCATFDFTLDIVDDAYNGNQKPGWSRIGKIDSDGLVDVVAGGGNVINWYKAPGWTRYTVGEAGCNGGVLFDVDGDGDLDVITSVYSQNHKSFWFENPADPTQGNWTRRVIDNSSGLTFQHDLEIGDIDMDGDEDDFVILHDDYRTGQGIVKWYRMPSDPKTQSWQITTICNKTVGGVGLAVGDINGDTRNDIVRGGKWYAAPNPPTGTWTEHTASSSHITNVRLADMDNDTDLDIVTADGWAASGKVMWLENVNNGSSWIEHGIATLDHPENMVVLDLDRDNDYEVITGEMKGETNSTFLIYEGSGNSWTQNVIDNTHGSPARMNPGDIDGDGDMDIVCDGNGQDHIYLWRNDMALPVIFREQAPLLDQSWKIEIAPHPVHDRARFEFFIPGFNGNGVFEIINPAGHIMLYKQLNAMRSCRTITLNLKQGKSQLCSGVYVVNLLYKGNRLSRKFLIQR